MQLYRETLCRAPPSRMAWQGDALSLVSLSGLTVIDAALGHTVYEQGFGGGGGGGEGGESQETRLARCYESER